MMNSSLKYFIKNCKYNRGFTLIEVMVVMVIVAILATGVVFMFSDPTAKVKAAAFEMRGDLNLARAEAVRRNENVLVEFIDTALGPCNKDNPTNCCSIETPTKYGNCFSGGTQQGYVICLDANPTATPSCGNEGSTSDDLEENVIKVVLFRNDILFYDGDDLPAAPDGPQRAPVIPPATLGVELSSYNGITFTVGDYIYMNPNGTSSDTGAVIIYLPKNGDPSTLTVKGKPYAVVVENGSTGRVVLERWRLEKNAWDRK